VVCSRPHSSQIMGANCCKQDSASKDAVRPILNQQDTGLTLAGVLSSLPDVIPSILEHLGELSESSSAESFRKVQDQVMEAFGATNRYVARRQANVDHLSSLIFENDLDKIKTFLYQDEGGKTRLKNIEDESMHVTDLWMKIYTDLKILEQSLPKTQKYQQKRRWALLKCGVVGAGIAVVVGIGSLLVYTGTVSHVPNVSAYFPQIATRITEYGQDALRATAAVEHCSELRAEMTMLMAKLKIVRQQAMAHSTNAAAIKNYTDGTDGTDTQLLESVLKFVESFYVWRRALD
jgi:hypothetical protein